MEGADHVVGQLHGDKECPFSGVTKSGRVWRKVPESDTLSVHSLLYSLLGFQYSQPPESSYQTTTVGSHTFCLWAHYMEWPSPSSPAETFYGLLHIKSHFFFQNNRPAIFSIPCCCFPLCLCYCSCKLCVKWVLYNIYNVSILVHAGACVHMCVCMYALRIVLPVCVRVCLE